MQSLCTSRRKFCVKYVHFWELRFNRGGGGGGKTYFCFESKIRKIAEYREVTI